MRSARFLLQHGGRRSEQAGCNRKRRPLHQLIERTDMIERYRAVLVHALQGIVYILHDEKSEHADADYRNHLGGRKQESVEFDDPNA